MEAAGAYLWMLRDRRKLSRNSVAAKIREIVGTGTNDTQVMRIEKGQPTNPAVLAAFTKVVDGDWDQVSSLLASQTATTEMGRKAAEEWLKKASSNPDQREKQRQQGIALIDALLNDPARLGELIGFGRRLLDEQGRSENPEE